MEAGALQRLLDEADCRALLMRYGPAIDWRDRPALEQLFWPDAEVDLGVFKGSGAEAPAFLIENANQSRRRWHLTSGLSLRIDGDTAYAESYAMTHAVTDGAPDGGAELATHLFVGRYLDRLERRSGEWRIAERRYLLHGYVNEPYADNPALAAMTKADDLSPASPLFRPHQEDL